MALTRRQRARAGRGVQYAIAVAILLVVAFTADWAQIGRSFFDLEVAASLFPDVLTVALKNTVVFTSLGFLLALGLGLVLALMRLSSVRVYRWAAGAYIEFFRGLPALLVVIAIGFGIPLAFGSNLDRTLSITLALGIVGSAYISETIRAGIQAVPAGQVEAARSLGMSPTRTMTFIVIPQAFRTVLPPLTNELILLTKDSSLAFLLGTTLEQQELAQFGRAALNQVRSMTPLLVVGLCYLIITIPLSYLARRLERRYGSAGTPKGAEV
ncbi:amino acid ABC transporter permease [Pseudonocardia sp. KRD-184]|uniref:Amino acid ABC transporter permease n=1 Tax=Pseudonocardia oceani TaxID=2792013 RepID=A0ABS6UAA9_9PSEU|nr:amino acid ABC transporter permease [Pseudonocardia oceani]MBW0089751.1 amino acid ABC transporter permease [Pseudonocardia oceani]MBW0095221.1 amino acid ABC transporter permease [Pseudonocardia oceani]MBW0107731.1 amino acid ABC transporter permease [Pseudonocardia oceani]MBW0121716.1 amino acid ABC transporter permease [Pseudonocardia oceani]MBW0129181.1 amino acid ABC transporter permease [Pseudonocardia oceani]